MAFVLAGWVQAPWFGGTTKAPSYAKKNQSVGCLSGVFKTKKRVVPKDEHVRDASPRSPRLSNASTTTQVLHEANEAAANARQLIKQLRNKNRATERLAKQEMKDAQRKQARIGSILARPTQRRTPSKEAAEQAAIERELAALSAEAGVY